MKKQLEGDCGLRETRKFDVKGHERTELIGGEDKRGKLRPASEGP